MTGKNKKRGKAKKKKMNRRVILAIFAALVIIGSIKLYRLYDKVYGVNVNPGHRDVTYLHIPTGANMEDVMQRISQQQLLEDVDEFKWLAQKKNYPNHIHPGRYRIEKQMSNNALINRLRSGQQEPVDLTFNNIRTKEQLAGVVSDYIEADSSALLSLMNDRKFLRQFDMTPRTAAAMFIPNTYEFWWNTSAREFIKRMHREYDRFWGEEKQEKAREISLTPVEVTTLASIVDEETIHDDEMPDIAGVYINRLNRGMRLQADPTIKFAINDFTIKRVLKKHLETDSPYNTYRNAGLPPGPISIPSIAAIESVLNYNDHNYLYFAAKPDFSGYHNFSRSHRQHINNARKYQRALNRNNIMK